MTLDIKKKKKLWKGVRASLVVRIQNLHRRGLNSIPGPGTILHATLYSQNTKNKKVKNLTSDEHVYLGVELLGQKNMHVYSSFIDTVNFSK